MTSAHLLVLSVAVLGCQPSEPRASEETGSLQAQADTISYLQLYESGVPYGEFMAAAERRRETWQANYARAVVAPPLLKRAATVGPVRLLVVAEDWCGDSANTIPYLARLSEEVPNLSLRIIDSERGRAVMEAHRTPDGRAATPTVVALSESGSVLACWVERPGVLQTWYLENEPKLGRDELLAQKYDWYDGDLGESTVRDLIELLEAARSGSTRCPGA